MTREEAIQVLKQFRKVIGLNDDLKRALDKRDIPLLDMAIEALSAEPKWITDSKPMEDGRYLVTLECIVCDRFIDLMHYGKPLMPNSAVKGKCWYDSDDEWGDVIYNDDEILAWMPLPKPYAERREP